jgi:hypothetical protein
VEKWFATLEVSFALLLKVMLRVTAKTEATTLKQSTAASIFWTLEEMDQIIGQLAYVGMCSCLAAQQPQ